MSAVSPEGTLFRVASTPTKRAQLSFGFPVGTAGFASGSQIGIADTLSLATGHHTVFSTMELAGNGGTVLFCGIFTSGAPFLARSWSTEGIWSRFDLMWL